MFLRWCECRHHTVSRSFNDEIRCDSFYSSAKQKAIKSMNFLKRIKIVKAWRISRSEREKFLNEISTQVREFAVS